MFICSYNTPSIYFTIFDPVFILISYPSISITAESSVFVSCKHRVSGPLTSAWNSELSNSVFFSCPNDFVTEFYDHSKYARSEIYYSVLYHKYTHQRVPACRVSCKELIHRLLLDTLRCLFGVSLSRLGE